MVENISFGILPGTNSDILSLAYILTFFLALYVYFDILSGMQSDIWIGRFDLVDILTLFSIYSGILPYILSDTCPGIASGMYSDLLFSGMQTAILSGILPSKYVGILAGISGILSGKYSGILSNMFWHGVWSCQRSAGETFSGQPY